MTEFLGVEDLVAAAGGGRGVDRTRWEIAHHLMFVDFDRRGRVVDVVVGQT